MTQGRWFVALGALSGALAVIAGAFAAHGLADHVADDALHAFRTASEYHLIHSLVLCIIGVWLELSGAGQRGSESASTSGGAPMARWLRRAGWLMSLGMIGFSGSLYLLALGGPGWLGPVTPLGGLCLIGGWLALAGAATRK